jgi:hypothetical protein
MGNERGNKMRLQFNSHDPAQVAQLERMAICLERRLANIEAADPQLVRLKEAERQAAAKADAASSEAERAELEKIHEDTVWALIRFVQVKKYLRSDSKPISANKKYR